MDTIFALSSGQPPAGIAVMRISGPQSGAALRMLTQKDLPPPRLASLRILRDRAGEILDHALTLWFPGPSSVTGEDLAELHLHGGRAVIAAVHACLRDMPGMREAQPGEFTRRAFVNGRIDLAEAEGLADLLSAETELQRRSALAMADGQLSRQVGSWRDSVLTAAAGLEALLDFSDEDDVTDLPDGFRAGLSDLAHEITSWLDRPRAEKLQEGFRVVLAGPPNSGKSTLLNAIVEHEAAITSPVAGTTRDVLACPVAISGVPFVFVDTAGLRDETDDEIERQGIARAQGELIRADLVLWLGHEGEGPQHCWEIDAQYDVATHPRKVAPDYFVSAVTGLGMDRLKDAIVAYARQALPKPGSVALNARQHLLLRDAEQALSEASTVTDSLILAELLRASRIAFDRLIGQAGTEDMLDALFGRFCIGK